MKYLKLFESHMDVVKKLETDTIDIFQDIFDDLDFYRVNHIEFMDLDHGNLYNINGGDPFYLNLRIDLDKVIDFELVKDRFIKDIERLKSIGYNVESSFDKRYKWAYEEVYKSAKVEYRYYSIKVEF